jgi:transposase-like protein
MLIVETIGRIRREHLVKGKSIKEIARDLKISRNTVRKILRWGETSISYERGGQPRPRLGRWKSDLDRMLTANLGNAARERLTLIRLFEELRALGYDAVRRYARSWSRDHASQTAAAFVPLSFAPGEAYQFGLEPRDRCDERRDGDRKGRSHASVPQPDDVRSRLST